MTTDSSGNHIGMARHRSEMTAAQPKPVTACAEGFSGEAGEDEIPDSEDDPNGRPPREAALFSNKACSVIEAQKIRAGMAHAL